MTGRDIQKEPFRYHARPDAKTVLEVKNLSLANGFADCSFSLREGEILGITGLLGSGRTELAEAIFGYHAAESGGGICNPVLQGERLLRDFKRRSGN